jgi:hypothetical protein
MTTPQITELTRSFVLDSFESASMRVTKDWYTIYSPFIILIFFLVFFFAFAIGSLLALFINWDTIKKFFMIPLSKICNFFIKIILLINVLHIINFIYQVDMKCFNPNSSDKEVTVLDKAMVGGGPLAAARAAAREAREAKAGRAGATAAVARAGLSAAPFTLFSGLFFLIPSLFNLLVLYILSGYIKAVSTLNSTRIRSEERKDFWNLPENLPVLITIGIGIIVCFLYVKSRKERTGIYKFGIIIILSIIFLFLSKGLDELINLSIVNPINTIHNRPDTDSSCSIITSQEFDHGASVVWIISLVLFHVILIIIYLFGLLPSTGPLKDIVYEILCRISLTLIEKLTLGFVKHDKDCVKEIFIKNALPESFADQVSLVSAKDMKSAYKVTGELEKMKDAYTVKGQLVPREGP